MVKSEETKCIIGIILNICAAIFIYMFNRDGISIWLQIFFLLAVSVNIGFYVNKLVTLRKQREQEER